jgi:hypothetical protein
MCKPFRWESRTWLPNSSDAWERVDFHSDNFSGRGPSGFTILPIVLSERRRPGKPGSWAGALFKGELDICIPQLSFVVAGFPRPGQTHDCQRPVPLDAAPTAVMESGVKYIIPL